MNAGCKTGDLRVERRGNVVVRAIGPTDFVATDFNPL